MSGRMLLKFADSFQECVKFVKHLGLLIFICKCTMVLEKAVAPHSSTLAWKIPWTEEPSRLQSMTRLSDLMFTFTFTFKASLIAPLLKNLPAMQETPVIFLIGKIPWRREWLPTPVFWPGEFHGLYSPWGHKELDTTE